MAATRRDELGYTDQYGRWVRCTLLPERVSAPAVEVKRRPGSVPSTYELEVMQELERTKA